MAPSKAIPVLPVRSALPGMSPGMESPVASRHALMALRVAMGPSSGVNVGSVDSQPGRPWPDWAASQRAGPRPRPRNAPPTRHGRPCRGGCSAGTARGRRRAPRRSRPVADPRISLVSRISSTGKGSPWALAVSVRWGEG